MHVQFSGRYRLQVFHGDTDILLKDTGWFDNLITNNGLDLLGTGFYAVGYVGSDTAAPAVTDTSITSILATATSVGESGSTHNVTTAPYYNSTSYAFTFGIGAIQGTIAQVAVGASSSSLFSKALLTGVNGSPTTLTLSGIDRLILTYELRLYIRTTDTTNSIDINGVTYACVNRAMRINESYWWRAGLGAAVGSMYYGIGTYYVVYTGGTTPFIGALTGFPSGAARGASDGGLLAYVAGTYVRNFSVSWSAATGDLTNITAAKFGGTGYTGISNSGTWQCSIEGSTLNKTQYQTLTLEGQFSWARYP